MISPSMKPLTSVSSHSFGPGMYLQGGMGGHRQRLGDGEDEDRDSGRRGPG
jgi:hypothetical protein